jgi:hypothetical protein
MVYELISLLNIYFIIGVLKERKEKLKGAMASSGSLPGFSNNSICG